MKGHGTSWKVTHLLMADSTSTIDAAGSTDRAELGMDRSKNLSSCRDVTVGLVTDVSEGHERRKVGKYVSEHTPGRAVTVVAAAAEAQRGWRRAREGRCERGRGDHARCVRGNCKRWKAGVDAGLLETRRVEGRDGRAWGAHRSLPPFFFSSLTVRLRSTKELTKLCLSKRLCRWTARRRRTLARPAKSNDSARTYVPARAEDRARDVSSGEGGCEDVSSGADGCECVEFDRRPRAVEPVAGRPRVGEGEALALHPCARVRRPSERRDDLGGVRRRIERGGLDLGCDARGSLDGVACSLVAAHEDGGQQRSWEAIVGHGRSGNVMPEEHGMSWKATHLVTAHQVGGADGKRGVLAMTTTRSGSEVSEASEGCGWGEMREDHTRRCVEIAHLADDDDELLDKVEGEAEGTELHDDEHPHALHNGRVVL